jgi:ubiquinone/menaquinone biosynthesis C-methylase UbiE
MKGTVLHVGAGSDHLPEWLSDFKETRLDINPDVKPDIVASMTDFGEVGTYDRVFCQHALEHLHDYDVDVALKEFYRVLNDKGGAIVFVPDLEDVKPTREPILNTPSGWMSGLDLIYGFRKATKENPYMKHLTGFTSKTLESALLEAGFQKTETKRLGNYNLMGVGAK